MTISLMTANLVNFSVAIGCAVLILSRVRLAEVDQSSHHQVRFLIGALFGASATYWAFRMVILGLGWDHLPGTTMVRATTILLGGILAGWAATSALELALVGSRVMRQLLTGIVVIAILPTFLTLANTHPESHELLFLIAQLFTGGCIFALSISILVASLAQGSAKPTSNWRPSIEAVLLLSGGSAWSMLIPSAAYEPTLALTLADWGPYVVSMSVARMIFTIGAELALRGHRPRPTVKNPEVILQLGDATSSAPST